jgi:hypothetical protein
LVGIGFATALLTNIARTTFLSFSAARDGVAAVAQWHDPAGYTVLTVCLVIIAIFAQWFKPKSESKTAETHYAPSGTIFARTGILLAVWLVFTFAATEAWYYKPAVGETPTWTLVMPPAARTYPLPDLSLRLLGCDRSHAADWRDEKGDLWTLYFIEWFPSSSRGALLARVHRPDVCLPAAGFVEAGPRRSLSVNVAGFDLVFESMHFRDPSGRDVYVFNCPWEIVPGQPGRNVAFTDQTRAESLRRVWHRERLLGQQVAELSITGPVSREAAEDTLRATINSLIRPSVLAGGVSGR